MIATRQHPLPEVKFETLKKLRKEQGDDDEGVTGSSRRLPPAFPLRSLEFNGRGGRGLAGIRVLWSLLAESRAGYFNCPFCFNFFFFFFFESNGMLAFIFSVGVQLWTNYYSTYTWIR